MSSAPVTVLCLASYHKGDETIRELKRSGARVILLTAEKLRDAGWPLESVDRVHHMPDLYEREHVTSAVSWLARDEAISRIVALDEFDLEMAATLREHLRLPGMGETTVRYFRDKLAMRIRARDAGIAVPDFVPILNYDAIRHFFDRVPAPWVLKPRYSASAIGIRKLHDPEALWRTLDELGDQQSHHLLERFVPGRVYHVDSIAWDGELPFAEAHAYLDPPFDVYHGGGLFCTRTLDRDSADSRELIEATRAVTRGLGMTRGPLHTEFIRAHGDGKLYFLETAARVGGAFIADLVEAATGVNLWREWARVELADARGERYAPPAPRRDYGGLLVSLARQEWPDTSPYDDPEVVVRLVKHHHAGLILASPEPERVEQLLHSYVPRFRDDFHAAMPAAERAVE